MNAARHYIALDLGAGSGRAMLGTYDGKSLTLQEAHRFPNDPVALPDGFYWDVLRIFGELKLGLMKTAEISGGKPDGLAIDTWGVDYALLDKSGRMLANPHNYRDPRTDGVMDTAFNRMSREEIFGSTGIQFMQINTLYQLLSQVIQEDASLAAAERLLMIPDLLNYWLTGIQVSESSIASTSQCYNPIANDWADDVLVAMNIPRKLFPEIVNPGTVLGSLRGEISEDLGIGNTPVIAAGSHDTASAVAAVPLTGEGEAYLSSGTWSLLGMEIDSPAINEDSLRYNFTNEVGVEKTIRLLKNISGLWIIQEMRRVWTAAGETISYDGMADMAEMAEPFKHFIDNDDPSFMPPGDMPSRIARYCERTNQAVPEERGAIIRAAFESLVFKYRLVTDLLERITGRSIHTIHIVGGGTRNTFLNQWAASATGRTIKTGPSEATATGNIITQMLATGEISSLAEGRDIIRASFPSETFEPRDTGEWDEAYERYLRITGLHI